MRFGLRLFFPSLYRKIKDPNPSISEDFTKTFLKWPRDRLETTWRQCWSFRHPLSPAFVSFCESSDWYQKHITSYKISKIVPALWLAEMSVCMRICKHGCGVRLFGFSCANHASTKLKSFRVQNSTSLLYLPIPSSAETWKIATKKVC